MQDSLTAGGESLPRGSRTLWASKKVSAHELSMIFLLSQAYPVAHWLCLTHRDGQSDRPSRRRSRRRRVRGEIGFVWRGRAENMPAPPDGPERAVGWGNWVCLAHGAGGIPALANWVCLAQRGKPSGSRQSGLCLACAARSRRIGRLCQPRIGLWGILHLSLSHPSLPALRMHISRRHPPSGSATIRARTCLPATS